MLLNHGDRFQGLSWDAYGGDSGFMLKAFFTSWNWQSEVTLVVAVMGALYGAGWWRLRKRGARIATGWDLTLYLGGLATVCLALISPIDSLAPVLFLVHMIQHELLTMIAAPLLLLANPLPAFLWALPRHPRLRVGRLLSRGALLRRGLWAVTWMPVAWLVFVVNLWAWHHPAAYQAALRNTVIHDIEHLAFFGAALLFWWPVINPAPRVRGHVHYGLRILYIFLAAGQDTLLAGVIGLADRVLYPYYTASPRLWGLGPLDDQAWGGAIMWVTGSTIYTIAVLLLVAKAFDHEDRVARLPEVRGLEPSGALGPGAASGSSR
jgi:cytochrome c oxidase assembly factor CtaG